MAAPDLIKIEVAYAAPDKQRILALEVPAGTTIGEAVRLSGIAEIFPSIDLTQLKVGVFSQSRELTDIVLAGDRVEIYRPLTIDPKEARRARAKLPKTKKA
jgi:putative ubiquitin-RnfH superfamily antitoxin RatB of RatAB toxin-antitoxin module